MGKLNLLSMKCTLSGIFVTLILILLIPLLFLLSQETSLLSKKAAPTPTPTPTRLTFANGTTTITGYIYHDTNHDGQRGSEEKPFKAIPVQIKKLKQGKDSQLFEAQTDTYGYFSFKLPLEEQTSYMIKIIPPKGYKTEASNPLILSELRPNLQNIVEFGLISNDEAIPSPSRKPTSLTPSPTTTVTP